MESMVGVACVDLLAREAARRRGGPGVDGCHSL